MRHATDYLVVGAGASGMAFADALVDSGDAHVVIVDRRHAPGGHWLDAYPFVRLHQASVFYGVPSTQLGDGRLQTEGPEKGLHERATAPEICAYYERAMDRLERSGRVTFLSGCEWRGGGLVRSLTSGQEQEVRVRRSVVDATYLEARIPATSPPPFGVADDVRVVPVNDLVAVDDSPSQYVVVGSGKTATDAIVWLLERGIDPDQVCWVRPRDPWMLNRAKVQPDPAVFLGMAADVMEAAAQADSLEELFLRLEGSGVLLRIDRDVMPTMARTPTLAQWELDLLRRVERVVRLGHVRHVEPGSLVLEQGTEAIARDAVVVHCAAAGLRDFTTVPVWAPGRITVQPIRSGFPLFGAGLIGHVEATRDGVAEKNRVCPSSSYSNTMAGWARMQVLGARAAAAFNAEPDLRSWANACLLNPARVAPERAADPGVLTAQDRIATYGAAGVARMAQLAGSG